MNKALIGQTVTLNPTEQLFCIWVAEERFKNNRASGVTNSRRGSQPDFETDLEGFASEMAFCKLFNLFPDFSIEPRSSQNDTGDVKLHNGKTVDIKATIYANGRLIAVPWKTSPVDYFALMIGSFPTYRFMGFMKREDLINPKRLGNLGYGPTYIAEQKDLKDLVAVSL